MRPKTLPVNRDGNISDNLSSKIASNRKMPYRTRVYWQAAKELLRLALNLRFAGGEVGFQYLALGTLF